MKEATQKVSWHRLRECHKLTDSSVGSTSTPINRVATGIGYTTMEPV